MSIYDYSEREIRSVEIQNIQRTRDGAGIEADMRVTLSGLDDPKGPGPMVTISLAFLVEGDPTFSAMEAAAANAAIGVIRRLAKETGGSLVDAQKRWAIESSKPFELDLSKLTSGGTDQGTS